MNLGVRIQLSIMMFLQFFVWGAWFVPMGGYLPTIGFTGEQIGFAYSTTAIAAIVSPFFMGMVADRFFNGEKVLGVLHLLGGVLLIAASKLTDPSVFLPVVLLHTLCYMPTLGLINSVSFDQMTDPDSQFPGVRLWGTLGWIVAGLVIGFGPSLVGAGNISLTAIPFQIAGGASILLGIYCFTLPKSPPKSLGHKATVSDILGLDAIKLMKDRSFAVFVISSFLICIPLAYYYQSGFRFFSEAGMPNVAGWMTLGQVSETVLLLIMPMLMLRLGFKKTLLVGMGAWVLRYFLFAFGNTESFGPYAFLFIGIALHGICYDFFFVAGQLYVDKRAPESIRASAQGFIVLVTIGLGMLIGNNINGKMIGMYLTEDFASWKGIWLMPAVLAALVMVGFALLFKDNDSQPAESEVAVAEEPVAQPEAAS